MPILLRFLIIHQNQLQRLLKKIALEPIYGYAKSDIVFERVITLGQNCIPKGHVNAFFNPSQIDSRKTKKGQADLFDWMTIDDYDLFAKTALNKLDDFFEQQDFKIVHTWCELLVNKKYNMGWWHLFHSEFEGLNEDFTNVTEEKLNKVFPLIKGKINYLKEKFISAKDKKTLYIISTAGSGPCKSTITNIRNALTVARDNNKEFAILFVPQVQTYTSFENIIVRESKQFLQLWHGGNQIRWNEILSEFKFSPAIWN